MRMAPTLLQPEPASGNGAAAWTEQAFELLNADTPAAHALATQALSCTEPDSSPGGLAQHALGMTECLLGRIAPGRALLLKATEALRRHGPPRAELRAWRDYGSVLTALSGDMQAGIEAFQQALKLAESIGDAHEEGAILARIGPALVRSGRTADAQRVLERAVLLLADGSDRRAQATALDNLGHVFNLQRAFARAVPLLRQERQLRDPVADRQNTVNCEANLAIALAGVGQADEARALIDGIAPRLDPAADCYQWADYLLSAGQVCLLLDDAPGARRHLQAGLEAARQQALHAVEIELLSQLSMAEERCGDLAAALASARALRDAERQWLDEQTTRRMQALEASIELAAKRAENTALERARIELEQRVAERTAALSQQVREREAAEERARYWADHDWLTRLPNRGQLQARLDAEFAHALAQKSLLGLLFVDLDGFKSVNDAHGHLAGDRLLRETARRLLRHAPAGALVARYGGDEFVVLLPGLESAAQALAAAQRLRRVVLRPLKLARRTVVLSCSIGVAIGPQDARSSEELLRRADRAMLEAKAGGRNQVLELDAQTRQRLERRAQLRRELGAAIDAGRLTAAYQPLWDVQRQGLGGVELLARWQDPHLGPVAPTEFIPVAEESGLIHKLGLWAVREAVAAAQALRQSGQWKDPGSGHPRVSVNVSPMQLADPELVHTLVETVSAAGGNTSWIELELTESVHLAEDPATQQRMRQLREAGFTLAIDDFGAGYSSFSYLNRAYFDRLKIDRALIQGDTLVGDRSAVIGSIILMAHNLGLGVVAEGVETLEQASLLSLQGCDRLQGSGIADPMPLEALLQWQPEIPPLARAAATSH